MADIPFLINFIFKFADHHVLFSHGSYVVFEKLPLTTIYKQLMYFWGRYIKGECLINWKHNYYCYFILIVVISERLQPKDMSYI